MKIGIVTLPLWGNYGGLLQNFALQQVLINMGHHPITFDYIPGQSGVSYCIHACRYILSSILKGKFLIKLPKTFGRKNKTVDEFLKKYINTSKSFGITYSRNLVRQYGCDAVIVGSDQVWRPKYNNRQIENQFLKFCNGYPVKRIAYAASFGSECWEYSPSNVLKCSKLLEHFNAVSVREFSGLEHLKKLGRTDGEIVLDPTLLLGRDGFDKILGLNDGNGITSKYLGAYMLDKVEGIENIFENICINYSLDEIKSYGEVNLEMGPIEWIRIIKNASYFITDSFHGTVFCIMYHIPFTTIINKERGSDRFISLLSPLGLIDRMVSDPKDIALVNKSSINWDDIENKISNLRKSSLSFLTNSLA